MLKRLDFNYRYLISIILIIIAIGVIGELFHKNQSKKIYAKTTNNKEDSANSVYTPQNISVNSTGSNSQMIDLNKGLIELKISYSGTSNIKVDILNRDGDPVIYIADHKGPYLRRRMVYVPETGKYILDVKCDGKWSISGD